MALRLRIVGDQAASLGDASTKVFGVHGGSIGRGRDNDWILPDPDRYLSGSHARVDFRAGSYVIVDTSSNGTYVNDAGEPLGKFHEYTLQDGDFLRLGSYEFRVSIDATNDFPPDAGGIIAYDGGPPDAAVRTSTANDLGADLDLSELLEASNLGDALPQIPVRNIYGQTMLPDTPTPAAIDAGAPWHMMTRPIKIERPEAPAERIATPPARATFYDGDVDAGLAALCRGAGIDPHSLPGEARAAAMQLAGQLLREAVLGLMDLQQGRAELRNRLNVGAGGADESESSMNLTQGSVQEILVRLLSRVSTRAGSVDAMREKFRDLKAQNAATVAAMQSALSEMLARFAPQELEQRFQRSAKRGAFGAPGKEKYWDMYAELYAMLAQRPPDGFPHLFADTFSRDFEARMRELGPPRRGSFGGES
ncbi:MAG: type VI secretion system-associated FHA domain protein TagH [Steroidobacterales bacterium]